MFRAQRSRGQRVAASTVAMATTILIAVGVTGATADSKTTDVAITPLTPVKVVTGGAYVAANKTYAFVASGGSTTVPSNAMVVQLAVTVKGTGGGTLSLAPLGDPANASSTKVSWPAGGTGSGTVKVNVGVSNKVVVTNTSTAAATIGVTINGYSTQTTAAGISGSGGTNGQVLTNNGDGTAGWKTPSAVPTVLKAHVGAFGTVEVGAGVSAVRNSTGSYSLTFPRQLTGCVATGAPAIYQSGQMVVTAVVSTTINGEGSTLSVNIRRPDITPIDSDFSVIVVC